MSAFNPTQRARFFLTLCEATARTTNLRKMQFYKNVFYQKNEALLFITTLPCLKVFASLMTKNKSKSSWHTEKFPKIVSKRSHQEKCVQSAKTARCVTPCVPAQVIQRTSKLPQQPRVLSDRRIDFQSTLSSRSLLESSAGKPFTSSSTIQTPRQELRTASPQCAGTKGSATSEGQKDNFFCRTKVFSKRQHDRLSLSCMHAKNGWRCSNHNYQKIRLECT